MNLRAEKSEPTPLAFAADDGFGSRATIGLIVLETDQTLEMEARSIAVDGVSWFHARIPNEAEVTPESLTAMRARLPVAAGLLPTGFGFDAIGYGCTSAATLIGEDVVRDAVREAHPGIACTNPVSAAIDAFNALGAARVAVITPYIAQITAPIIDHFTARGVDVAAVGSFLESNDLVVARISEASIADAVRRVAAESLCDAVFVSCTSLRTFGVLDALESELAIPVVSSNAALLWRLLRLVGIDDSLAGLGSLLRLH